jgi:hypothetical protein
MRLILILLAACAVARPALAQDEERKALPDPKFYRLDFVLKELEAAKIINARTYPINISPTQPFNSSSVRTINKVQVPTGATDGGATQYSYLDVGVNLDCRAMKETANSITLQVVAEIITLTPANQPLVNITKWNVGAAVPLRKATTLVSADGATNKRQMQLEVTATPLQ